MLRASSCARQLLYPYFSTCIQFYTRLGRQILSLSIEHKSCKTSGRRRCILKWASRVFMDINAKPLGFSRHTQCNHNPPQSKYWHEHYVLWRKSVKRVVRVNLNSTIFTSSLSVMWERESSSSSVENYLDCQTVNFGFTRPRISAFAAASRKRRLYLKGLHLDFRSSGSLHIIFSRALVSFTLDSRNICQVSPV